MSESIGAWVTRGREMLHLAGAELALVTGIAEGRLAAIEADRSIATFQELSSLSRFLGVDLSGWDPDEEPAPSPLPGVTTLFKSADRSIALRDWDRVLEIAQVARDIVSLEHALGLPDRMARLRERWSPDGAIGDPAWADGQRLARVVHASPVALESGRFPEGVRALCDRLGVVVIESFLPDGVDALCFADDHHGPTIVADVSVHVLALRFRVAHELCHVLFDRPSLEPLQRFDRFDRRRGDDKPPVEQRADAFAIHLLAPETAFRRLWQEQLERGASSERCIREAMERFGVSFQATHAHALNLGLLSRDERQSLSYVASTPPAHYDELEREPTADAAFSPLHRERRGRLLGLTLLALSRSVISTSRAIELLGVDGDVFERSRQRWMDALGIAR